MQCGLDANERQQHTATTAREARRLGYQKPLHSAWLYMDLRSDYHCVDHCHFWIGLVMLLAAAWYWYAMRWMDKHGGWK
jgi:hypothetical protein